MSRILDMAALLLRKLKRKPAVHLLHLPKTGGTAVKFAIKPYLAHGSYVIIPHPHKFKLRDVPDGDRVCFMLRDPIARFGSAFYSRQRQGRPRYSSRWTPSESLVFRRFDTADQLAMALSSRDAEEIGLARMAMTSVGHFASYWEWFESEQYFLSRVSDLFFIGFQERLDEDFSILRSKLGLPEEVQLPSDHVQSHKSPSGVDRSLSDEAIRNLKVWYERDYELIALCERIIREHPEMRRR